MWGSLADHWWSLAEHWWLLADHWWSAWMAHCWLEAVECSGDTCLSVDQWSVACITTTHTQRSHTVLSRGQQSNRSPSLVNCPNTNIQQLKTEKDICNVTSKT